MNTPRYTFGLAGDTGANRTTNQDVVSAVLLSETSDFGCLDMGLFIVADGMGGDENGQKAAQIAVDMVTASVTREIFNPLLYSNTDDVNITVGHLLTTAVQKANARVLKLPSKSAAGCTLTAALLIGELLYIAHVGDTRAYHFAQNQLAQLTEDHTLANTLVRLGEATWDDLRSGRVTYNHSVHRALGQSEELQVDITVQHFLPSSQLLLCSDGLSGFNWDYVQEAEIFAILRHSDPQTACNRLVTLALERGTLDNLTALVVSSGKG
ncbi:MAG: protein phosphatase 2C domain-containing protein [Anaerolineae bacterium]